MALNFFSKQLANNSHLSQISVRLQKIIIALWVLSVLQFIFEIVSGSLGAGFAWNFWVSWLAWLLFACGFWGAYKRNAGFLLTYFVIVLIWIIIQGFALLFTFLGAVALSGCTEETCDEYLADSTTESERKKIVAILWVSLIIYFIWWCVQIYSATLASRLRRFLLAEQRGAIPMQTIAYTTTPYNPNMNPNQPPGPIYVQPSPGYTYPLQQVVAYPPQQGYVQNYTYAMPSGTAQPVMYPNQPYPSAQTMYGAPQPTQVTAEPGRPPTYEEAKVAPVYNP